MVVVVLVVLVVVLVVVDDGVKVVLEALVNVVVSCSTDSQSSNEQGGRV